jgi:hypothetical protein
MSDIEKIAAELMAGLGGATKGPFIVVPATSKGDPADIYMDRNEDGIYEGWVGEMAMAADAEHFARCSPGNIRALLSELSRLSEAEPTDKQIKRATAEYLSYCGENPYRVLRGGQELWEARAPAMREAFRAARRALQGSDNGLL